MKGRGYSSPFFIKCPALVNFLLKTLPPLECPNTYQVAFLKGGQMGLKSKSILILFLIYLVLAPVHGAIIHYNNSLYTHLK